jgi:chromosome segregation ATPase
MSEETKVSFFKRLLSDFGSAKRYVAARSAAGKAASLAEAAKNDLQRNYLDLGRAAADSGLSTGLPAFAAVRDAKDNVQKAKAVLATKRAAASSARDTLAAETDRNTAAIAALDGAHKPLAEAASAAQTNVAGGQREIASLESAVKKTQADLQRLGEAPGANDPAEAIEKRLAELQQGRTAVGSRLTATQQSLQHAVQIADAKAGELKAAARVWQATQSKLQSELAAAQVLTTGKEAAVQSAQQKLDAGTQKHKNILAAVTAENDRLAEEVKATKAKVQAIQQEMSAADSSLQQVQTAMTAQQLRRKIAESEQALQGAKARLSSATETYNRAAAAEQAKAGETAAAREAWQAIRAKCEGEQRSTQAAEEEAAKAVQTAEAPLAAALTAFGKAVCEAGATAPAIAALMDRARALLSQIADLEKQITSHTAEAAATKGGATRAGLYVAAAVVILAGIGVGVYFLVRAIAHH